MRIGRVLERRNGDLVVAAVEGADALLERVLRRSVLGGSPPRGTDACPDSAIAQPELRELSDLDIRIADHFRFAASMGDRALARRPDLVGILAQRAALIGDCAGPSTPCARAASSAASTSRSSVPFSASIEMMSPSSTSAIGPPTAASGPDMADAEAARGAREAAVGDQRDLLADALAVERRRGRQHLAHAGAALGALVADDDDVAFLVLRRPRPPRTRPPRSRSTRAGPRNCSFFMPATFTIAPSGASVPLQADDAAGRR